MGATISPPTAYLAGVARASTPVAPTSVALVLPDDARSRAQVEAELHELFPAAAEAPVGTAALVVVAAPAADLRQRAVAVVRSSGRRHATLWLYAVDTGRIDTTTTRRLAAHLARARTVHEAILLRRRARALRTRVVRWCTSSS